MSEVMKPEDREPNYKAAMLYHSDRADVYMAERDAALAREANLREALAVYVNGCDADERTLCSYEGNMCCKTARAALQDAAK